MRLNAWMAALCVLCLCGLCGAQGVDVKYETYYQEQIAKLPVKGVALFDGADLSRFRMPNLPDAKGEIIAVEGQGFGKAIRVEVAKPLQPIWTAQLQTPVSATAVKKGDVIFVSYQARCTKSMAESGGGHFSAHAQATREPWTGTGSFSAAPGKPWFHGYTHFVATQDYPAGDLEITFHLGQYGQTIDIGGLVVVNLGAGVDTSKLPVTRVTYAGREPDAAWRQAAAERIERFRKGDVSVKVVDGQNRPVAGASVRVRMTRHAYQFGTFLEDPTAWQNADGEKYREHVLKWFNRVTVPIYWADWGWPKQKEAYLARARWAKEHGFYTRGHNIIWPDWRWMPTDVKQYEKDPAKLRQVIRDHFVDILGNFKQFEFDDYDVVNEVRDNHTILDICGKDVIVEWFKLAKQLDPKPRMGINEYSIIAGGGWTVTQQESYEQTIQYLLENGAPLEVIGMQCHFGEDLTPPARVVEILDRFGKFNLPLHATEFDVSSADEQAQADYLRDFYTAFFSHPATESITMWGFWEKVQWIPRAAMLRSDWTEKPNAKAYQELVLGKWWTDTTITTGADGTAKVRGFLGDYEVAALDVIQKAKLGREGLTVTLQLK